MVVNTNYIHNIGGYGEAFKIEVNGANPLMLKYSLIDIRCKQFVLTYHILV